MIKKTVTILIIMIQTCHLFGQTNKNKFPVGSWIGEIKIGESSPRLVFHIMPDSIGALTGTVDSPDKGVIGIPLSRIHITGDSAVFEISGALAKFKGVFSVKENTIEGIWTEGETIYPLTLDYIIDTDSIKEKESPYEIQKTTQHFEFYCSESDRPILDKLANTLEENYPRITDNLQTQFIEKIRVLIYPDIRSFHTAIYMPDAPEWVVGAAGKDELMMVSPLNPGSVHSHASLIKAIVHELTHTAVINVRVQGLVGLPKWLNEGFAFYEANQMTDGWRESVKANFAKEELPSWTQLDNANTVDFGDMDGYALSTTIIEFLVNVYGFDKLRQLILTPKKIESIYGFSSDDLEKQWAEYLRED